MSAIAKIPQVGYLRSSPLSHARQCPMQGITIQAWTSFTHETSYALVAWTVEQHPVSFEVLGAHLSDAAQSHNSVP